MAISKLKLSMSVLGLLLSLSPALQANEVIFTVSCRETLEACDDALGAADEALEAKDAIIEVQASQLEGLAKRNAELKASRDSLFNNPLVWFLGGAILGGLSYGLVTKVP